MMQILDQKIKINQIFGLNLIFMFPVRNFTIQRYHGIFIILTKQTY